MAVGLIKRCENCGKSYDEGKTKHYICDPYDIKAKQERESWPQMSVEEKCEWLKKQIEEVKGGIPYNGPF